MGEYPAIHPGLPLEWKLKNELVKTERTPSCLGSNPVAHDVTVFDQCDLHAAASVTKSITGWIKYFVCS